MNGVKQDYSMKLGEGGEAFFVFETTDDIPESLQTSPLVSPATSPKSNSSGERDASSLQEPDYLDLSTDKSNSPARNDSAKPWAIITASVWPSDASARTVSARRRAVVRDGGTGMIIFIAPNPLRPPA